MTVDVGSAIRALLSQGRCGMSFARQPSQGTFTFEQTRGRLQWWGRAGTRSVIARRRQPGGGDQQVRLVFDGRPRGEGYTHFKSAQGHSIGGSGARFWYPLIAGVPGSLLLYYVFHLDRAPFTNRIRMIDLSREKELAIGAANYRSLLASHPVLPDSHPASKLVQKVGYRIAAVAGLGGLVWEFKVLDSPMVNAACLPGGKVVVFRGLLDLYNYDETALAVVLAHEAGHVVARHAAEQLGFANLLLWAEFAVNIVFNARFITNRLFTLGGRLPYSRKLELEADYIGLMLLAKTCRYDPGAAPGVFETLGRATGKHVEFLATHPNSDRRIQALREALPEARKSAQSLCASLDHWLPGSKSGSSST
jgi:predicted Zn-dependent protease